MRRYFLLVAPTLIVVLILAAAFSLSLSTSAAASYRPATGHRYHPILYPTTQRAKELPSTHVGKSTVLGNGDLQYHNGSLQSSSVALLVFWGSYWNAGSGCITPDGQVVQHYFGNATETPFASILTQYHDTISYLAPALTYGGTYPDFTDPPTDTSCGGPTVEDTAIQSEVQHVLNMYNLLPNVGESVFVFTPPTDFINDGFGDCSDQTTTTGCAADWASSASCST